MLNNGTPAGSPTNVVNSEQLSLQLFGAHSTSHTSQTFTVDQQPYYLSAYNLGSDDIIKVQQVVGQGSGTEVADYAPVLGPVQLSQTRTKIQICYPGRYQLLHTGSSALGTFTVLGASFTMTQDNISELAEGLISVLKNLGVVITGTLPIAVTGAGTIASPYTISETPATQSDMLLGTSTTTGVTPFNLSYIVGADTIGGVYLGGSTVKALDSCSIGTTSSSGIGSVSVGAGSHTSATAVGIGEGVNNAGTGTVADDSVIIGYRATTDTTGTGAVGIGREVASKGLNAVSVGKLSRALGDNTVAVGFQASANSNLSISIGHNAALSASNAGASIAIGDGAFASSSGVSSSIAIGNSAGDSETHTNVILIGNTTNATQNNQAILGNNTITQLVTAGSIIQGGVISPSDARLKNNVEAEWQAIEKINLLQPVTFRWNQKSIKDFNAVVDTTEIEEIQHGLIAQEVETIFPEFVHEIDRGHGPYKVVKYEKFIPVILAALQDLSEEVNILKGKLNGNE